jgi:hypothetical protein
MLLHRILSQLIAVIEAATEDFFLISQIFFTATLFRYPTNVEVVLGIVETEENG